MCGRFLNKRAGITDNICVENFIVYGITSLFFFSLLPVYVSVYAYADSGAKYASVNVCLYRVFRLVNINSEEGKMKINGKDADVTPDYLDDDGLEALKDAREYAKSHSLNPLGLMIYDAGDAGSESYREVAARCAKGYVPDATVNCIPPVSGAAYDAIIKVMSMFGLVGEMRNIPLYRIAEIAYYCVENKEAVLANRQNYIDDTMLGDIRMKEKYNGILSDETLRIAYADEALDFNTAYKWIESFIRFWEKIEGDADGTTREPTVSMVTLHRHDMNALPQLLTRESGTNRTRQSTLVTNVGNRYAQLSRHHRCTERFHYAANETRRSANHRACWFWLL